MAGPTLSVTAIERLENELKMVIHSLLTGGDNTWQDILFHNTPSYITSTIILSHKSNMKFNMIIFLHQSVSQGIDGTHL